MESEGVRILTKRKFCSTRGLACVTNHVSFYSRVIEKKGLMGADCICLGTDKTNMEMEGMGNLKRKLKKMNGLTI